MKKIALLLCVALLLVAVVGCGGGGEGARQTPTQTPSPQIDFELHDEIFTPDTFAVVGYRGFDSHVVVPPYFETILDETVYRQYPVIAVWNGGLANYHINSIVFLSNIEYFERSIFRRVHFPDQGATALRYIYFEGDAPRLEEAFYLQFFDTASRIIVYRRATAEGFDHPFWDPASSYWTEVSHNIEFRTWE